MFRQFSSSCINRRLLGSRITAWSTRRDIAGIHNSHDTPMYYKWRTFMTSGVLFVGSVGMYAVYAESGFIIHADYGNNKDNLQSAPPNVSQPLSSLLRSYVVYSLCSMPAFVDWSPTILSASLSIPGLKLLSEFFIRHTFFAQFVGGDTAHECLPLMEQLRAENKGCLFAYSIEVDESKATGKQKPENIPVHKRIVEEIIRSIDVAADFEDKHSPSEGRKTWVAVKMTALLPDADALIALSRYILQYRPRLSTPIPFPGCACPNDLYILDSSNILNELTSADIDALKELHEDLVRICTRAKERSVRIIIDAEYSWYQPAIDAFTLSLTRRFNKLTQSRTDIDFQPLVYGTYQAYLRRTTLHLKQSIEDARKDNYALGIKLVRGAYHEYETAAHGSPDTPSISTEFDPPVFLTKAETDECYNSCAKLLIENLKKDVVSKSKLPRIGILFGTHNLHSCQIILEKLVKEDLTRKDDGDGTLILEDNVLERLTFGQLLGMKDDLTEYLTSRSKSRIPLVLKYVPYGALSEVMPYLSRRAIENKSVLDNGGATEERKRVGAALRKKISGF